MGAIRRSLPRLLIVATATLVLTSDLNAQDLHPSRRLSPVGIAKAHVGDTYVKVTYGRPYIRGRAIFGAPGGETEYLVPFGQPWRLGANEATEITVTGPVRMAGQRLGAGTYSMFAVPGAASWRFHISPQLGLDGMGRIDGETGEFTADVYDPSLDVLVVEVPSSTVAEEVDPFTIDFERAPAGVHMVLRWENTEVRIPITPATT